MLKRPIDDLGDLQKSIMEIVWKRGEVTARQVQAELNKHKNLAYTSVLSIMQRLEKYGWLKHRQVGRAYIYSSVKSREQESKRSLSQFLQRVFHGNAPLLLQNILENETLSDEELKEMQQMIQNKRREVK